MGVPSRQSSHQLKKGGCGSCNLHLSILLHRALIQPRPKDNTDPPKRQTPKPWQETNDHKGAWRARQIAHSALGQLNTFFEQCLALPSHACNTDLIFPTHVAMVEKLLAQSGQQANMNFNPF